MSDLPAGWEWATFDDVAQVASNLVDPADFLDAPHIAPNHIESGTGRLLEFATVRVDNVKSAKHRFFEGQILYSKIRPYLAKVALANFEGVCSADMYPINTALHPGFLKWWMLTDAFTESASRQQARSVLPKINAEALRRLPVPVPPIAEQRRIIEELEMQLTRLGHAAGTLEDAAQHLSPMLAGARAGALRRLSGGAGSDGVLADVIDRIEAGRSFGASSRPAHLDEWGIVKVSSMTWGQFNEHENKVVSKELVDPRYEIRQGDILVSRANTEAYVGAPVLVGKVRPRLLLSDKSLRLVPKAGVDRRWLLHVLASPAVRDYISKAATGTKDSMRNISQGALRNAPITTLCSADQERVSAELDELQADLGRLGTAIRVATAQGEQLRRSLLASAFAGRLVPQDPSDEPASDLLARIRAERAAEPKKVRRARAPRKQEP